MRIRIDENKRVVQWSDNDLLNELLFDVPEDTKLPKDFTEGDNAFFYRYEDGKFTFDKKYQKQYEKEQTIVGLRNKREQVCFPVINRGEAWYRTLSDKQKEELQDWYQKWLDATETLTEPEPPEWLK